MDGLESTPKNTHTYDGFGTDTHTPGLAPFERLAWVPPSAGLLPGIEVKENGEVYFVDQEKFFNSFEQAAD